MRIAIYAFPGVTMFHLAVPQMVFDEVRRLGLADWSTELFSGTAGAIRTAEGLTLSGVHGADCADDADLIVVPSWFEDGRSPDSGLLDLLRRGHARGATIAGLCLGAIPVADAGILAGRRAVTHWQAFGAVSERHPDIDLDESVLYVDHGDVLTAAGTASGLDACLHIVRGRLGAEAANRVARSLVVAPHREGGQAQYIDRPLPVASAGDPISDVLDWSIAHLDQPLSVDQLAQRAHMSRRTFVRAFHSATGSTPAAWIRARRLDESRRLLETTQWSVERIAEACGFGSAVTFRQSFASAYGVAPSRYRRTFEAVISRT